MEKIKSPTFGVLSSAANSIWVPALFFANIFLTGFLFGSIGIIPGYSDHLWDFANGMIGAGLFYLISRSFAKNACNLSYSQLATIYLAPPLATAIVPGVIVWLAIDKLAGEKILKDFLFSFSSLFGQFFIYALLIGAFKYSRQLSSTVASQYQALSYIRHELATGIAESKAKLMAQIQEILKSTLSNFKAETSAEVSAGLQVIIDGAVRPLSHMIDAEASSLEQFDAELESAKKKALKVTLLQQLKRKVPISSAVSPLITLILYFNFVATSMVYLFGYQSLLQIFAPFIALSYLFYLGLEKATINRRANIFIIFICGLLISIIQSLIIGFISSRRPEYDQGQLQAISFTIFLLTSSSMIYSLLLRNIVENSNSAEKYNVELANESRVIRQQLWHLHKRIARELHGNLQSKLQVAAIKAEDIDLQGFYADFTEAISAPRDDSQPSLSETLDDLIEFWNGVCQIKLSASEETLKTIENQAILGEYLLEVIRETINNAIKHAASNEILISIELQDDLITLSVINNVQETTENSAKKPSLGSKIFEELAASWSLELGEKQSKFTATLFLNR
jgi:signal transduction histidine kinase